jgi:hypothetical protein
MTIKTRLTTSRLLLFSIGSPHNLPGGAVGMGLSGTTPSALEGRGQSTPLLVRP